jgi:WD40 repeat protein
MATLPMSSAVNLLENKDSGFSPVRGIHILLRKLFFCLALILLWASNSDNTCKVWDVKSSECLATLTGHTGRIWSVSTNKQGSLAASASGDGTVKIWDLKSMDLSTTIIGHNADVYSVKFHPLDVSYAYDFIHKVLFYKLSPSLETRREWGL